MHLLLVDRLICDSRLLSCTGRCCHCVGLSIWSGISIKLSIHWQFQFAVLCVAHIRDPSLDRILSLSCNGQATFQISTGDMYQFGSEQKCRQLTLYRQSTVIERRSVYSPFRLSQMTNIMETCRWTLCHFDSIQLKCAFAWLVFVFRCAWTVVQLNALGVPENNCHSRHRGRSQSYGCIDIFVDYGVAFKWNHFKSRAVWFLGETTYIESEEKEQKKFKQNQLFDIYCFVCANITLFSFRHRLAAASGYLVWRTRHGASDACARALTGLFVHWRIVSHTSRAFLLLFNSISPDSLTV